MKCQHCHGTQIIQQGKKLQSCPYCMTAERLIKSINRAISDCKKDGDKELARKLKKVLAFLPDYSVMAIMEAEALGLNNSLILMIKDTFNILPFGDQEYKKEKS